jgi:hypothetical protein
LGELALSLRSAVLFDGLKPANDLRRQWTAKGALQPLSTADILAADLSANGFFRGLWPKAFPTRRPLPFGPIARKDGSATDDFWEVFG